MLKISGATLKERSLIRRVERACFKAVGQENFFVVDMTVTHEDAIKALNASARGVDKVTDVLSFPCFDRLEPPIAKSAFSDSDFDGSRVLLGSVMICRERAEEQAAEYGHSYARELGFLACHGMLHLLGYDHIEKNDEEIMTSLQRKIMDSVKLKRSR